jgi:hypothetical protein
LTTGIEKKESKDKMDLIEKQLRHILIYMFAVLCFFGSAQGQSGRVTPRPTPPIDADTVRIVTEEVKLNVSAFNSAGRFFDGVTGEDLIILEDGVIHQPASVRRVSTSVILILDTGGEDRQAKDFATTRDTAKALIMGVSDDTAFAIVESSDSVRVISEWTNDKDFLIAAIDRNLRFGRRSSFVESMRFALEFFEKSALENRHIIAITDGVDSLSDDSERDRAIAAILGTDISFHAVSYTTMEQAVVAERRRSVSAGRPALPPGATPPVQGTTPTSTVGLINLDREMIRTINERSERLRSGEKSLSTIASSSGGEFLLPSSREQMVEDMGYLSRLIDSFYVVTYNPKRPLEGARLGEQREIRVGSRRPGLLVEASRKLVVTGKFSERMN